jgi:hypothetical protein
MLLPAVAELCSARGFVVFGSRQASIHVEQAGPCSDPRHEAEDDGGALEASRQPIEAMT